MGIFNSGIFDDFGLTFDSWLRRRAAPDGYVNIEFSADELMAFNAVLLDSDALKVCARTFAQGGQGTTLPVPREQLVALADDLAKLYRETIRAIHEGASVMTDLAEAGIDPWSMPNACRSLAKKFREAQGK